eukprot:TRINITY_DN34087_c0_g1_i1.p1 TRINITY_DN34087_c0_g1~~TRINITY_DN34087_c0_g1_i1.p1  ORF type:complete len:340 (-),score=37.20 TRINITY_DN34087_c0_g1_i1:147-1166(-)
MPNYVYNTEDLWTMWKLPNSPLYLRGFSRAGCKTALWFPPLRAFFDAGVVEDGEVDRVFITHSHADHSYAAPYLHSRHHKQQFYLPEDSVEYFDKYLASAQKLNDNGGPFYGHGWDIHGVKPGTVIPFNVEKTRWNARVIECCHTVPCVGYGVSEIRQKLKPEYVGKSGPEIKELRQQGVEIVGDVEVPHFAFLGDTNEKVFEQNPTLASDYPVIILECTILTKDEDSLEGCNKKGHIHWEVLKPVVEANPKTTFLLIHFSTRYSDKELMEFFAEVPNVVPLVPGVDSRKQPQPEPKKGKKQGKQAKEEGAKKKAEEEGAKKAEKNKDAAAKDTLTAEL